MPTATKERGAHLGQGGADRFGLGKIKTEADLKRWLLSTLREPEFRILLTSGKFVKKNELVYDVLDHKVKAGNVEFDDQSALLQALTDRIAASGHGGTEFFPARFGPYTVNDGWVVPENRAIYAEGEFPGWRSTGGKGSVLMRRSNPSVSGQPMLLGEGSDSGDSERCLLGVRNLQFDGGADAGVTDGEGVVFQRGQETYLEHTRFYNFPKTALRATQIFNGTWIAPRVTHSGDGTTDPAISIESTGTPGNVDGTITLDIFGLQQEQNNGTDLQITGNPNGAGHPSTEINIIGGKWEGGVGVSAPYHHHEFSELNRLNGGVIFCHREVPPILVEHLVTGDGEDRMVQYSNYTIEQAAGVTDPDYLIDVQGGAISFEGELRGDPAVAHVRIDNAVRAGAVAIDAKCFTKATGGGRIPLVVEDNRTNPEF